MICNNQSNIDKHIIIMIITIMHLSIIIQSKVIKETWGLIGVYYSNFVFDDSDEFY